MVSATVGWAVLWTSNPGLDAPAALELARTTDGGRVWMPVTPAAAKRTLAGDLAVLEAASGQRAYLAVADRQLTTVFGTADGGRTWRQSRPFPAADPEFLDFVGWSAGWLLASDGAAMQQNPVQLYQTTDGGLRWALVAGTASSVPASPGGSGLPVSCDKSGLAFRSARVGWITSDCNVLGIWRSADGGRHWAVPPLPVPDSMCEQEGCSITAPRFFGRTGFLTVDDPPDAELVLVSSDGGGSWSVRSLPAGVNQAQVTFFSASSGIAVPLSAPQGSVGPVFYVTADGGQSWHVVRQGRRFGSIGSVTFDFVSAADGFAWTVNGGVPVLYRTTDSGGTWVTVAPVLGRFG
jgi:hypothetical protein